jgi:hypothetical protein
MNPDKKRAIVDSCQPHGFSLRIVVLATGMQTPNAPRAEAARLLWHRIPPSYESICG